MAKEGYERGMKTRRKVLGDEWVDRAEKNKNAFNAEFQELITRFAWDEIWNRPGLDHRTRRLIVIAQCAAMGRWEEFKLHTRTALEKADLTQDDVKEVLLQTAVYCGLPTANTAFREAREVISELAKK
jgi:4-carboxymuconolactone decarboxylase